MVVRDRKKVIDFIKIINQQFEKNEVVLERTHRPLQRQWVDLRVTIWRQYEKKIRKGCRDDLDKYCSDTIWQRTAQDRLTWRRHAEPFAQPRDTSLRLPNDDDDDYAAAAAADGGDICIYHILYIYNTYMYYIRHHILLSVSRIVTLECYKGDLLAAFVHRLHYTR